MILAAIDIGSNAARLLISETADCADGSTDFTKLQLLRVPLRLGMDVFSQGFIGPERLDMLTETMKAYRHLMNIYQVSHYRACATSAMRDAANGPEIIDSILQKTGIRIEIINGQQEASLIFETHIAERLAPDRNYLYIDVGGGSTEVTLFAQNKTIFKESFNIGTIRLLNGQVTDAQWERMKVFVKNQIAPYIPLEAIGSGGNINKIFSMSKRKEGRPLSLEVLRTYYNELNAMSVAERMHQYGFRPDRADVIVPALQIFINLMRWTDAKDIYVPKVGLADGLLRKLYADVQ